MSNKEPIKHHYNNDETYAVMRALPPQHGIKLGCFSFQQR